MDDHHVKLEDEAFMITNHILYADDTILMSNDKKGLQILLLSLIECARAYGLDINWEKTYVMNINGDACFVNGDGAAIKEADQ
eukprot:9285116-Karenia_brevis.AAC.1